MIAFFHFGINTFEEYVNEGDGKASTAIFNPTALDCRQWMQTLKSSGDSRCYSDCQACRRILLVA